VDQISVAGNGRVIAFATTITEVGVPAATRDVILLPEEDPDAAVRLSDAAGDNDQPSVDFDSFGSRVVWRGSDGARGTTTGNIYLRTLTRTSEDEPDVEVVKLTSLVSTAGNVNQGTAFDPTLTARVRFRDVGSGISVKERDARVAFVSTGDLDRRDEDTPGENPQRREQLFLWLEQENRFEQLTGISVAGFKVARPSIDGTGDRIAFESDADLTPAAVDPKDPSRVGNPAKVRQIFLWERGRGIRQLTWSTGDCLSPRISRNGRTVLFSSKGEPIAGANPEGNHELFRWTDHRIGARRLEQITQTAAGDNVLPRPTRDDDTFVFWSTSSVPSGEGTFGLAKECGPSALLWHRGRITRVHGYTDAQNVQRILESPDPTAPESPVVTGPPCPGFDRLRVHFATNEPRLNERGADDDLDGDDGRDAAGDPDPDEPDDRDVDVSVFLFHLARAVRATR
jgi:dipeptidyl aminopeptidase/acylaminoacyl peptidase